MLIMVEKYEVFIFLRCLPFIFFNLWMAAKLIFLMH